MKEVSERGRRWGMGRKGGNELGEREGEWGNGDEWDLKKDE